MVRNSVSRVLNMPRTSEHPGFENRTLLRNAEWVLETIKRELLARSSDNGLSYHPVCAF